MRKTIIELLSDVKAKGFWEYGTDRYTGEKGGHDMTAEDIADYLLENGVTVQRWIPVTERLPDTIPCGAGTEYSEAVNVLTDGRKVLTAIWNGLHWICDAEFWDAEFEGITHWAPVLLPLPKPPKRE